MAPLIAFFMIVFIGLLSSTLFRKLHFPWVVALILGGILVGPEGFDLITIDGTTDFIAQMGLTFLMFMAGLETKLEGFKKAGKGLYSLAVFNGIVPFAVGMGIGAYMGFPLVTNLLIGVVFISSSIAVVIPALEANDLFEIRIGKTVMATSIIQDIASLLLLSFLLQNVKPISVIPLAALYPIIAVVVIVMRYILPKLRFYLAKLISNDEDLFQEELRSLILILVGTVIIFELLGLHSIIGAFFVGLVLSDTVSNNVLLGKIRAISYGLFIPTFFIVIGAKAHIDVLFGPENSILLTLLIVVGSILSKAISGFTGAKLVGFNKKQSLFFGLTSVPQLSTTLAVSYTATEFGLITKELNTAFIALSIISTVIGPMLMSKFEGESLKSEA